MLCLTMSNISSPPTSLPQTAPLLKLPQHRIVLCQKNHGIHRGLPHPPQTRWYIIPTAIPDKTIVSIPLNTCHSRSDSSPHVWGAP